MALLRVTWPRFSSFPRVGAWEAATPTARGAASLRLRLGPRLGPASPPRSGPGPELCEDGLQAFPRVWRTLHREGAESGHLLGHMARSACSWLDKACARQACELWPQAREGSLQLAGDCRPQKLPQRPCPVACGAPGRSSVLGPGVTGPRVTCSRACCGSRPESVLGTRGRHTQD